MVGDVTPTGRAPLSIRLAGALQLVAAAAGLLLGLGVTWVSGVDGSTTALPALAGAAAAGACVMAAVGAVRRGLRAGAVLALGGLPVLVAAAASAGSSDMGGVSLLAAAAWVLLLVLVTRRSARARLHGDAVSGPPAASSPAPPSP
jgi:hypothetical protein